jgi:hypothetical protein
MTEIERIEKRLKRLRRQEAYIRGMLLAEELDGSAYEIKPEKAMNDRFIAFAGLDRATMVKGFKSQKKAIEKRKAREELEKNNLFNMQG